MKTLDRLLTAAESAPVDWQNYLRNGIQQLNADLERASRDDFSVKGYPDNLDEEDLFAFWKETWYGFAATLETWPKIRKAAKELVAEGIDG